MVLFEVLCCVQPDFRSSQQLVTLRNSRASATVTSHSPATSKSFDLITNLAPKPSSLSALTQSSLRLEEMDSDGIRSPVKRSRSEMEEDDRKLTKPAAAAEDGMLYLFSHLIHL